MWSKTKKFNNKKPLCFWYHSHKHQDLSSACRIPRWEMQLYSSAVPSFTVHLLVWSHQSSHRCIVPPRLQTNRKCVDMISKYTSVTNQKTQEVKKERFLIRTRQNNGQILFFFNLLWVLIYFLERYQSSPFSIFLKIHVINKQTFIWQTLNKVHTAHPNHLNSSY